MQTTVIFDLDGTLTASGPGIHKGVAYALEKMGYPVPDKDVLDTYIGPPLPESFKKNQGMTAEECQRGVELFREYYSDRGIYENKPYEGMHACLSALRSAGFRLCVASSKPDFMVHKVLEHFDLTSYFSVILGAPADEGAHAGKAEIISQVLEQLEPDLQKDKVVYVGDRIYDVNGAKANGIPVIGVSYGYGGFDELSSCGADRIASSPKMLSALIMEMFASGGTDTSINHVPEKTLTKIWRIMYPMLLYLAAANVISFVGGVILSVGSLIAGGNAEDAVSAIMGNTMLFQGIGAAISLPFLIMFYKKDKLRRKMGWYPKGVLTKRAFGVGTVVFTIVLMILANKGVGDTIDLLGITAIDEAFQKASEMLFGGSLLIQILVVALICPIVEEYIFRALMYHRLRDYLGVVPSIWISAALFGIYHMNLSQGIFAFVLGIVLALLYEKYGDLKLSIIAHIANNFFAVLVTGLIDQVPFMAGPAVTLVCLALTVVLMGLLYRSVMQQLKKSA